MAGPERLEPLANLHIPITYKFQSPPLPGPHPSSNIIANLTPWQTEVQVTQIQPGLSMVVSAGLRTLFREREDLLRTQTLVPLSKWFQPKPTALPTGASISYRSICSHPLDTNQSMAWRPTLIIPKQFSHTTTTTPRSATISSPTRSTNLAIRTRSWPTDHRWETSIKA